MRVYIQRMVHETVSANANSRLEGATPSGLLLLRSGQAFGRISHAGKWSKASTLLLFLVLVFLVLLTLLAFCVVGVKN
jgi:hypothetical protein